MKSKKVRFTPKKTLPFIILINLTLVSFSQKTDSSKVAGHFGGAVTVTNNGISFIPNFTLGKPAAIFDLSMGKGRLSFEPQFRFALEGKPWSFIFWWRYELLKTEKFRIKIGAHPAVVFKTVTVTNDGVSQEIIRGQRYLAGEMASDYFPAKNISIGAYYLYGFGVENDVVKNTHMVSLRSNFSYIRVTKQYFMKLGPQFYYLKMDENDGYYFSALLTLARINFPFSITSVINYPIHTQIPADKNFLWNVSLIYSFNKVYIEK